MNRLRKGKLEELNKIEVQMCEITFTNVCKMYMSILKWEKKNNDIELWISIEKKDETDPGGRLGKSLLAYILVQKLNFPHSCQ